MISETNALTAILAGIPSKPGERVSLIDSLGRFAGQDLYALRALPPFDNSAMDGYAVVAASCRENDRMHVVGEQPAGLDLGLTMKTGEAIRIFTGAPMPTGADAVLMQEEATRDANTVVARSAVEEGEFVRRRGRDLAPGQKILTRGDEINPQILGLLASQGIADIEVGARPKVAIVATGDELAWPGDTPLPGQIFESNSIMLQALVLGAGGEVAMVKRAPDELEPLTEILRYGLESDILIVSGGVSVGDRDLVKPSLDALGAEIDLWRVAIKPGKPFLFGRAQGCSIFGLPGNPVSAFVTFLRFVRPALRKMAGAAENQLGLRTAPARLAGRLTNAGDRPHYFRGRLQAGVFTVSGRQESHALFGLSQSNALLRVEAGGELADGAAVVAEIFG